MTRRSKQLPELCGYVPPTPPAYLSDISKGLFITTAEAIRLNPDQTHLLTLACHQRDLWEQAREQLARDGLVVTDRWGQCRSHPCNKVLRDSLESFRQLMKQLDLIHQPFTKEHLQRLSQEKYHESNNGRTAAANR